jgi:hypothetical protein
VRLVTSRMHTITSLRRTVTSIGQVEPNTEPSATTSDAAPLVRAVATVVDAPFAIVWNVVAMFHSVSVVGRMSMIA